MSTQSFDRIDDFLLGNMTEEDQKLFEEELAIDAELKAKVEEQKLLLESLYVHNEYLDLKKEVAQFANKTTVKKGGYQSTSFSRQRRLSMIGIAASVAALVSFGIYLASHNLGLLKTSKGNYALLSEEVKDLSTKQRSLQDLVHDIVEKESISNRQLLGTCFPITQDGFLVTSYHLVSKAKEIRVEIPNQEAASFSAEIVHQDEAYDLALLYINDTLFTNFEKLPYGVANATTLLGSDVYTLGYPKRSVVYNEGAISSLSGYQDDTLSYQLSISVNPGNSGAPVFDQAGNVVGVVLGKHSAKEGVAFAIKSEYLLQMATAMPGHLKDISEDISTKTSISYKNRTSQIASLSPYILKLKVKNR